MATVLSVMAREGEPLAAGFALGAIGFATWSLGAYTNALGQIGSWSRSARTLMRLWARAQDMAVGMERAFTQVDIRPEVQDAEDAVPVPAFRDAVVFRDVWFGYDPSHPVLQGVDLEAKAGTITALVGPTGSGKSTLVSLLLRLFDPDRGAIEIDGIDLRALQLDSLRARVSIALQENLLFATTIRENIRYAVPGASDEEVVRAARVACADEFIREQAEGYETMLGERGARLSTGQRQRISIARAIIKDTPILVLDEPTASLDAQTELQVMRNLAEWGRGRAIFIVTHRLSTIRRADQIVYLRDGRVLEAGSHDALMQREGGGYRRFVELERASAEAPATESSDAGGAS
jgi:ABC-type multidrug transport system fused ATPase/permease subunit